MLERSPHSTNSLEIIQPFIADIGETQDVQIMGGLGTAALCHPDTEILLGPKEVVAPKGFSLPAYRDDGTKRDVDVLVVSSDPRRVRHIDDTLDRAVGKQLERSVFGIHTHDILQAQMARPLGFRAFRTFLSDRYEASADTTGSYVKSLFPFSVPIDPEAMETWTLVMNEGSLRMPIPHPGTTLANYANRSISGLRPRDVEKITHVAENTFSLAPEIKEWLVDGPGKSQIELATLIASLREPVPTPAPLIDGLHVHMLSATELIEHPAFMVPERSYAQRHAILAEAAMKATLLHAFETNPRIVTLWRQVAERRVDAIVKNA